MDGTRISRAFPRQITDLLIVRSSLLDYKRNGGRILTTDECPECDGDDLAPGFMYSIALCPHIIGHASVINGELSTCEVMYLDLNKSDMARIMKKVVIRDLKWIVRSHDDVTVCLPDAPHSELMLRASTVYADNGPMTVYNRHAAMEAADFSGDSGFWQAIYPPLEKVSCYYGMYGLIHDNTTVSLGVGAGDDVEPNIENRTPKADQCGFMDACFTPQSKSAGKVRSLVIGTSIRIMTKRTLMIAADVLGAISPNNSSLKLDWVVRCMGFCSRVTRDDVARMMTVWKMFSERNMPTLHVFEQAKVIVISVVTGVITRPLRTKIASASSPGGARVIAVGPYVDTMMVYHSDALRMMNLSFPTKEEEPEQYFNAAVLTIPFGAWTAEPRLNLGVQMLRQSMSMSPIKGDATMTATGRSRPLVTTPVSDMIISYSSDKHVLSLPGKPVTVAFINRFHNTEDACSVSKEWAQSGKLSWSGYINYPLPSGVQYTPPGTILSTQPWWKPAIEGVVMDMRMSKTGSHYMVVYVFANSLEIGDKIATAHGLKFTVGELIDDKEMPSIVDQSTGRTFKPNILLSTKNMGRGVGGQIREMVAATSMFSSIDDYRMGEKPKRHSTFTFDDQKLVAAILPSGPLVVKGENLFMTDKSGERRMIKASYGIMSILHLRHMAKLKQHYASVDFGGVTIPKGRMKQGTPRLGEGELASMMMQGMIASVRDSVMTSDLCYVTVCPACNRLIINCDCSKLKPRPEATEVLMRFSTVVLDIHTTVASLASRGKGPTMALTYRTAT